MGEHQHRLAPERTLRTLETHNARVREGQRGRRVRRRAALLASTVLALLLLVFDVALWAGYLHLGLVALPATLTTEAASKTDTRTQTTPTTVPATTPPRRQAEKAHDAAVVAPREPSPASSLMVALRVTAVRGDSWLQIRRRSPQGLVLYSGMVRKGTSLTVRGPRLWARFGALGNLDLSVNGRALRPGLTGTLSTIISGSVIRPAARQTQSG